MHVNIHICNTSNELNSMIKIKFLLVALLAVSVQLTAQVNVKDSVIKAPFVNISFGGYLPGADYAERFGNFWSLGLGFNYKTKTNWVYAFDYNFVYSDKIKEDSILRFVDTEFRQLVDVAGQYAELYQYHRGHNFQFKVGKLIPTKAINPNSGFLVSVGTGYMQHKVKYAATGNEIPHLSKEYRKGYDRLTAGLLLSESVLFQFFSDNRLVNFSAGFEFGQGFTRSLRSYDFDLQSSNQGQRVDLYYGFKINWVLPLYKKMAQEFYFY